MTQPRTLKLLAVALIVIGLLLPLGLYWYVVGRIANVTPQEARKLLADSPQEYVLLDVRTPEEFASSHLDGAIHWPLDQVLAGQPKPASIGGRKMLMICTAGWRSARAAEKAGGISVRGGMQEWVATGGVSCPIGMVLTSGSAPASTQPASAFPFRRLPLHEQLMMVTTGFGVKPVYMMLTLVIVGVLFKQRSPDLVALRWAMIFFFIGESFCLANFMVYRDRSYLLEYLHNYGMVLTFAFTFWATFEAIDLRLIRYSDPGRACGFAQLCQGCIKHADVPCGLRRVMMLVIGAMIVVSAAPLTAGFRANSYTTSIFGTPYSFIHEITHQMYEIRLLPVMAVVLLACSLLLLLLKERHPTPLAKLFFAAGLGAMAFSFFRLMLLAPYFDNQVWFASWEEITELLYVGAAGGIILIFNKRLFREEAVEIRSPKLEVRTKSE